MKRHLHLRLLSLASVLMPAALYSAFAWQEYTHALASVDEQAQHGVMMLAEHTARVFDSMAAAFDQVELRLGDMPDEKIFDNAEMAAMLGTYASRIRAPGSLRVLDRHGRILVNSAGFPNGVDRSARDYFRNANQGESVHIAASEWGQVSGRRLIPLSRRRANGGVLEGSIFTRYFSDLFRSLAGADAPLAMSALVRDDGLTLIREPAVAEGVNDDAIAARLKASGAEDGFASAPDGEGVQRRIAWHKVPGYPVTVVRGIDVNAVLAAWRHTVILQGMLAAIATIGMAWFGRISLRRIRTAEDAETRLTAAVTERTAEAERRAAQAEQSARAEKAALTAAESAQAAKSSFLAAASHDLRQPIQALRLFLDVLGLRLHDTANRDILTKAMTALGGAEALLSALLDISTLEAGVVTPCLGPVNLQRLFETLAQEFQSQFSSKGLRLHTSCPVPAVTTDALLLARMVRNLLVNALNYTGRGGALLAARRRGGAVLIEVWDTGPGVPEDKQAAIFEDFVQLGNPERDRRKGLGLGLSVVRRTADLLGLTVSVCSRPGHGSVFRIAIPPGACNL